MEVNDRRAGQDAGCGSFTNTSFDRLDVFFRNCSANDFIFNSYAVAAIFWLNSQHDMAVLAASSALTDKFAVRFGRSQDTFAVSYLRFAGVGFDFMLSEQTVKNNFQMEFAHPGDNGLSGFFIAAHIECRVFFSKAAETFIQFVAVRG